MNASKKRVKRRHRGSIRTQQRVRYASAALVGALNDPYMAPHVALVGSLFASRRGRKVTVKQFARALAARDPFTGKLLRKRVNSGFRQEGDGFVTNVTHGFDVPLSVDKSVTVAALVFEDEFVLKLAMKAMCQEARWLCKKMDRRLRRGGQNATVATGKGAAFFVPEKAGRHGQPQLHGHVIIPNLTAFEEEGSTQFCAGHFRRITQSAMEAKRRMNLQLSRDLQKEGYHVELIEGVCRLPSVSQSLCESLSPVSSKMRPRGLAPKTTGARRRENDYLQRRPKKVLQPLKQWRQEWEKTIGPAKLQLEKQAYLQSRFRRKEQPEPIKEVVVPFSAHVAMAASMAVAPLDDSHDEVLEKIPVMRPAYSSIGVALRKKLQDELTHEARHQVVDLDYCCSEKIPDLVEHTEALRTSLRLAFPRLVMHLKFKSDGPAGFNVTGGAAANPKFARLIEATAQALASELGQDFVRQNWSVVLRLLHTEMANGAPEPRIKARPKQTVVPRTKPKVRGVDEPAKAVVAPPAPTPPNSPMQAESGLEWELMP